MDCVWFPYARRQEVGRMGVPPRSFLGVLFRCCGVYSRLYRNANGKCYAGRCPKCMHPVRVAIDAQKGVEARFVEVY